MADIEIPGVFVKIALEPIAKILGVKYLPKNNNKLLAKKVFEKFADRAQKLDTGTFQKIIIHLEKIIQPASSIGVMIATLIRPLVSIIPPQYLIIIVAGLMLTFLMFFFVYPAMFLGFFSAYKLEKIVKLPFSNMSKRRVNAIYPLTFRDQFIIKKIEKKTFNAPLINFLALPLETQYDYLYENEIPSTYQVILNIFKFLPANLRTVETLQAIIENPDKFGLNVLLVDPIVSALTAQIYLTVTYYSGLRRVFPPLLHRLVGGIKGFATKMQDSTFVSNWMKESQEKPWQAIFVPIVTTFRAAAKSAHPEEWKPEPNV